MTIDSANFLTIDIGGLYWHRFFPHEYIGDDGKTYAYSPDEINKAMADFQTWIVDRYGDQHEDGPVGTGVQRSHPQIAAQPQGSGGTTTQQPSAPAQGHSGQRETRADRFPALPNWTCDKCNGLCGRKARTGNMSSDAAVCLGKCKDGRYVYTVGWLDEDGDDVPAPTEDF